MAHVVIMGAGVGGLPCAYEMKEVLGAQHDVTLIDPKDSFEFTPSNPWVAVGWRKRTDVTVPLKAPLSDKGIKFIQDSVKDIDASNSRLELEGGEVVEYDYLVIATGPRLAFEEVPGSGPEGYTTSICTTGHAETGLVDYEKLVENPGPIIVGAMPFASCFGPAYEFAYILDTALRKKGVRDRIPITFVTSEPYIGHLGLGGVGDSRGMLESEMRNRHIKFITNARTTRVEDGNMFVEELNEQGEVIESHELPFVYNMMLPAFKGVEAVVNVKDLCNPRGFVMIDEHQRNPTYKNIFSAGVCVAIPPVEPTPVPTGAPKTGYMIESMASAIVSNIKSEIDGKTANAVATWNAICLADMGDTGAAFVAIPQIPPRNVTWFKKGKWVHLAKIAFEKYFIRKMRKGKVESIYETFLLNKLGIKKLKD
ncbi:MAG TPA: NAD(P)/FAD-dependent oxidoreductase [Gammaproteobacteria bacterium]|nr:NAD(P)/FAD-dependent oxidoreductase [Gammaproteobacteria bacterium]